MTNHFDLTGKVALVTGGSRGLGYQMVKAFAEHGADVFITSRKLETARIFSIVDVWDALTSDRPYREAWSKEKTRQYILERSGKQFDPQIVEAFFTFVAQSD